EIGTAGSRDLAHARVTTPNLYTCPDVVVHNVAHTVHDGHRPLLDMHLLPVANGHERRGRWRGLSKPRESREATAGESDGSEPACTPCPAARVRAAPLRKKLIPLRLLP